MEQEINKYYTPTIEEFHIGFEYEHYLPPSDFIEGSGWLKCIFPNDPFVGSGILRMKSFENIRVKYLDKEDIESLGFEQQSLPYQFKKDWYRLIKRHEENQYIIEDGRHQDQIFVGIIKNKSELKKLLTQLEIN